MQSFRFNAQGVLQRREDRERGARGEREEERGGQGRRGKVGRGSRIRYLMEICSYGDKEKNNQIPDSHFPIVYKAEDGLVNRYYVCAVAFLGITTTTSASKGFTLLDKKKSGIKEKF